MKHSGPITILAAALAVVFCSGLVVSDDSAASPSSLPQAMLSDLVIEPSDQHENAYQCSAKIIDPQTGETLSTPKVHFRSGEDAKIRTGVLLDGQKARVDVFVSADAKAHTAQVRVELVADGGPTTVQKLRVRL